MEKLEVTEIDPDRKLVKLVSEWKSQSPLDNMEADHELQLLEKRLNEMKTSISEISRTAKMWLQYQDYVQKINFLISCERLKVWEGHLQACTSLLNLFAATGHNNYARSTRLYFEMMRTLPFAHPDLYRLYAEHGLHSVQRTNHVFNGLSTDLVIEQCLMKELKNRGGLTHGRGMSESVRLQWVYTMGFFVSVHNSMIRLTGKKEVCSLNKELGVTRVHRDTKDLEK
jgi:hypothetical protein